MSTIDGAPLSGSLFDFGLYLFHNAEAAIAGGSGPYYYLPKLEGAEEAAWWARGDRLRRSRARPAARHGARDPADRDAAGGVRDGRDAVRAEGPCRRAQLRALGLYLQLHQALRADGRAAGPRPLGDDHGSRLPRRLFAAPDRHLPPPRGACDGRDGGGDPGQGRRGRQRRRLRARRRRQAPRGRQRP